MSEKLEPFKIVATTFLGENNGNYTYEIVFNQSMVHTGRFTGIENGLNKYREDEMKEHEEKILKEADEIRKRKSQ
jgi:hypothetical protein